MLYSNRLRLRASEREDIPAFVNWLNDPEVRQHLLAGYPFSRAHEEKWFQAMVEGDKAEQVLVIEIKTPSGWKAIGTTGFSDIDWLNRSAEVGIAIGEKDEWGKGYGRDTMKLLLRQGFNHMNLHRIFLRVHSDNLRGIKAYENAGFKHEGMHREGIFRDGVYRDLLLMSVLRSEWQDSNF